MARRISSSSDPAELFRADLITAMMDADLRQLQPGSYFTIKESWRREWEIGVQVCTNPSSLPTSKTKKTSNPPTYPGNFVLPLQMINEDHSFTTYDCDDVDLCWLEAVKKQKKYKALSNSGEISREDLQRAIVAFELQCQRNMVQAIATEEDYAIEYDETIACDVCREKDGEENNEMIFCDSCNICVHQACYGVSSIPQFSWLCRPCSAYDTTAHCILCPNMGGALKKSQVGSKWVHLTCALWIPEIGIGNIEKMEPITKLDEISSARWNLVCCLCKKKKGACIQCSAPNCIVSYHVTCGFKYGLEMKSQLDTAVLCVHNESYCPRHTAIHRSGSPRGQFSLEQKRPIKSSRLQEMEEEFYDYVSPSEIATQLHMKPRYCELFYNYWKLKRKTNHNHPLLTTSDVKDIVEEVKEKLVERSQKDAESNLTFMKLVRIRQDLEKSRNLSYMIQKREQLKRQQLNAEREMSMAELAFASTTPLPDPSAIPSRNKRGRPRKRTRDPLQSSAKLQKSDSSVDMDSTVLPSPKLQKLSSGDKSITTRSSLIDENTAKPGPIVTKDISKPKAKRQNGLTTLPVKRYPLRKNGHILCESKPLHVSNGLILQKKQPLIVIKKCNELQRLYNVSFSCRVKVENCDNSYYLRNGWKQELLTR
ncbi:protein Jade-1-like isoform X2 [Dysidea avara]|uniref:protein Jade-1-like isoform X2 n=1 Tax=Dysidea avara TaxID=196820 RepID=UPI00332A5490